MTHYVEADECQGDFWLKLEEAMKEAGGGIRIEVLAKMPLIEVVNLLAQNGIRMTYSKTWHINHLNPTL
jgi:hypothetical protein